MKKLYVGSLSYDTSEDALKDLFSQAGAVDSVAIIADKISGRSKGFGFVEMSSEEEAKKAIEMFNGKELDGRNIIVNEAKPMERKPFRKSFGSRGGFGHQR
jgi:RNA recognition motif-containing protein